MGRPGHRRWEEGTQSPGQRLPGATEPPTQLPTQRERGGAAERRTHRRARSVDAPGAGALSRAPEQPGRRSPGQPCAARPGFALGVLPAPGSGPAAAGLRSPSPPPGPAHQPRTTLPGSGLLSPGLSLGAGTRGTGCFPGSSRHGDLARVGARGAGGRCPARWQPSVDASRFQPAC